MEDYQPKPPPKRRKPKQSVDNDDFMNKRYSVITDNEVVTRRFSQQEYIGRRAYALRSMNNNYQREQDATILSAMHDEYRRMDAWSIGVGNTSRTPYISAKNVAMQINLQKESRAPQAAAVNMSDLPGSDPKLYAVPVQSASEHSSKSIQRIDSKYNDEDIYTEMKFDSFKPSCGTLCFHLLVFILVTIMCSGAFYYYYLYEFPNQIYYKMSYSAIAWFLCVLFLFLNLCDKFHSFHEFFASCCCHHAPMIFIALTIIFGLIEYVLWSLYEEELLFTESYIGSQNIFISLIIIDVVWYMIFFFLFCASMSNWPTISYYLSENAWIQAMLYMSFIGYIFIRICRKLRVPNAQRDIIAWYKVHDSYTMRCEIMKVTSILFLIFNILFGCVTPLFGEGVAYVSALGTQYAIGGYIILSFAVMLTPLMPGSIIDIAGGFLFVFVLVENHSFHISLAWIIAVGSIILLHYCGACAQWFIGSMRCVQFYLNSSLPPELLAASDSVLEDANCGTVGLIGYVFLDTANGLNQGRINMKFWTQLCSEWSCIPNAFAVVSLGATIALPALYPQQYESIQNNNNNNNNSGITIDKSMKYLMLLMEILIPLLALIAGLVQFSGLTLAARTLGKSIDSDDYMMAREKWSAVQFFYKVSGYVPSRSGWKHDVLQLGSINKEYPLEFRRCLFQDLMPLQRWYVAARNNKRIKAQQTKNKVKLSASKLKLLILEKYRSELAKIRNLHYTTIEAQYDTLINDKSWLINPNTAETYDHDQHDANRYFSQQNLEMHSNRVIVQNVLLVIFLITFWISFYRIYWQAAFFDRVAKGFSIFEETTEWYDWVAFAIFLCAWCIYNYYQIIQSFKNSGKQICFILKCCRINKFIESRFTTPFFDTSKFDKNGNYFQQINDNKTVKLKTKSHDVMQLNETANKEKEDNEAPVSERAKSAHAIV